MLTRLTLLRRCVTMTERPAPPAHEYDYDAIGANARWYYETTTRNEIAYLERCVALSQWQTFTFAWHNIGVSMNQEAA
jgi:hypothetical protein